MTVLSEAKIRTIKPKDKPFKEADFDGLFLLTKPNGSLISERKREEVMK
ncbi:hypothetical protein [uncultured Shimia sp.]|nr:hypothetical protein [uncultured Shimia sp.]